VFKCFKMGSGRPEALSKFSQNLTFILKPKLFYFDLIF
jgi:hypothetical protein